MRQMTFWWKVGVMSLASLIVMIGADIVLGAKAEFLNAWSVVERLLGRPPSAGDSFVAKTVGAVGELAAVVLANLMIGGAFAKAIR